MNIAEFFIRRPVATTLLMLGMLFFGIVGYTKLPVNQLPNVDFPTIQVLADLDGADPETMASSVATILERQFATIEGVDSMTSISSPGRTRIIIQFVLDRNIDAAAQDVQSAIGIRPAPPAHGPDRAAELPQGEPGGFSRALPAGVFAHPAAVPGERIRGHDDRPAHLHGVRRGAGDDLRAEESTRCAPSLTRTPWLPASSA